MGGTGWHHVGDYAGDIAKTLEAVQREVIASGEFQYWDLREVFEDGEYRSVEVPVPKTFEEFWATQESSSPEGGTHSILDVRDIRDPESLEADLRHALHYGGVYPLGAAESMEFFGTTLPTRADFERVGFDELWRARNARFSGRCVVLYDDAGQPTAVAFWGSSGY